MPDPCPAPDLRAAVGPPPAPPAPANVPVLLPATMKPGERPSLGVLFQAEESGLLRYGIGLIGRRSVAEELVQETFLRLHRIWGEVENPRAWLYRCLRNLALNHLRDRAKDAPLAGDDPPGDERPAPDQLGRDEAVGTVRLFIAELPPEDRNLIRLKYHDDLKYREISRRTGLSIGNVGYRLHHLLKALADDLRSAGIEGSQG